MPKLNTTIDNLEWRSSKITSTSTISPNSWTDTQYPSAKLLLNIAHPIGSILTTSTNTNPANTLGGSWTMVDKAFKNQYLVLDGDYWTATNADLLDASEASTIALIDHTINIRLKLQPSVDITDNEIDLGTLALPMIGLERLHYSMLYSTAQSDGGQCQINYSLNHLTGTITAHDAINMATGEHLMPAGQFFFVNVTEAVPGGFMLDNFCDKFYWKRTA